MNQSLEVSNPQKGSEKQYYNNLGPLAGYVQISYPEWFKKNALAGAAPAVHLLQLPAEWQYFYL